MWIGWGGSVPGIVWSHSSGAQYKPNASDSLVVVKEKVSPLSTLITSNLKIRQLKKDDEGSYFCHADDSSSNNSSQVLYKMLQKCAGGYP